MNYRITKSVAGALATCVLTTLAQAQNVEGEADVSAAIQRAVGETYYEAIWQVGTPFDGVEAAFQAPNAAQELRTWFLEDGVNIAPRHGSRWSLGLSLRELRRGERVDVLGEAEVDASGERVELLREGIVEWYRNDERGIEQGFDLLTRPLATGSAALELFVDIESDLHLGEVREGHVTLDDADGETTLALSKLYTYDATGRALACRFERRGEELAILVEDQDAVYPITIDPLITNETDKLSLTGGVQGAEFGTSIDQSSFRMVVGAPGTAAAYVFKLEGSDWELETKLSHSAIGLDDEFGCDVALSGSNIVIGAFGDDTEASNSGAVYSYELNGSSWSFHQKITSGLPEADGRFGYALDMTASWLMVGAPREDTVATNAGGVHHFEMSSGDWTPKGIAVPTGAGTNSYTGSAIDIEGTQYVVGTPGFLAGGVPTGAAHVYQFTGGFPLWQRTQTIATANTTEGGAALDLTSNGYLIVGSPGTDAGGSERGQVNMYDQQPTGQFTAMGVVNGTSDGDRFGTAVSMNGSTFSGLRALVGAPGYDGGQANEGAGYVIIHVNGILWSYEALLAPNVASLSGVGSSAHMIGSNLFLGAPLTVENAQRKGSVFHYSRVGSSWFQEAELKSRDADTNDNLGHSLAVDGDHMVVGAPNDDDAGNGAGAAYYFRKEGGSWILRQRMTAGTHASAFDDFGYSVDISDNTIVIGSRFDEMVSTQCGSAFIYTRNLGGGYGYTTRIVPPTPVGLAYYGQSVAVDGDLIVVGAHGDDGAATQAGAAYVYRKNLLWSYEQTLTGGTTGDGFGTAVDVNNGVVAVGSPYSDILAADAGCVRLFRDVGGSWAWTQTITESMDGAGARFGSAVALSPERLVVGSPRDLAQQGVVHVYERTGNHWDLEVALLAPGGAAGDRFGSDIDIEGDIVVAGAPESNADGNGSGAAWAFEDVGVTWYATPLLPSDIAAGDEFGMGVAIDGDMALIGAPDHNANGISNSGAAYTFDVETPQFVAFMAGDGSNGDCPCSNESQPGSGEGCENSTGSGGLLSATGSSSIVANDLVFHAENLPAGQPSLLFMGTEVGTAVPFGDGLKGVTGFLTRIQVTNAGLSGDATWSGTQTLGLWGAGDTRYFQVWYRDPSGSPCQSYFNLSSGLQVTFEQ